MFCTDTNLKQSQISSNTEGPSGHPCDIPVLAAGPGAPWSDPKERAAPAQPSAAWAPTSGKTHKSARFRSGPEQTPRGGREGVSGPNKTGSSRRPLAQGQGLRGGPVRGGGGKQVVGAEAGSIVWTALHMGELGLYAQGF